MNANDVCLLLGVLLYLLVALAMYLYFAGRLK